MIDKLLEKKREYDRRYRKNNREKIRRSNLKYRLNNQEKIKILSKNRICDKEKRKKYYEDNKDKLRIYAKKHAEERKERIRNYKINIGCQVCNYKKCADALDFHHTVSEDKIIDVSRLAKGKFEIFLYEAKKCIVVCKNCHAEIHYKLRNNIV